jgi:hypothetical protein
MFNDDGSDRSGPQPIATMARSEINPAVPAWFQLQRRESDSGHSQNRVP